MYQKLAAISVGLLNGRESWRNRHYTQHVLELALDKACQAADSILAFISQLCERKGALLSERDNVQSGNAAEIADIASADGISEFQCAGSDDEVTKGKIDSITGLLAADLRHDFSS